MKTERRAVRFTAPFLAALTCAAWHTPTLAAQLPSSEGIAWLAILETDGRAKLNVLSMDGETRTRPLAETQTAPLGSLWKLFVYLYLVDRGIEAPTYHCRGQHRDDVYCCEPNGSVGMQAALAQSCGPFFHPSRLGIDAKDWRHYWRERNAAYAWLLDPAALVPQRKVPIAELLKTLRATGSLARDKAQQALAGVLVDGSAKGHLRHLGSLMRAKTYTWNHPDHPERLLGGFAGWLNDGAAVWAGAQGSSAQVIERWGKPMAPYLERGLSNPSEGCVEVEFFKRYPIARVTTEASNHKAAQGVLRGPHRIRFKNGNRLELNAGGDLHLSYEKNQPRIRGRFSVNDYLARVLDREVDPRKTEAAKAFAVVARTYLLQNAQRYQDCYHIEDSSASQRVSPHAPTDAAKRLSYWTDGLIVDAEGVQYHSHESGRHRLAWTDAVNLADTGSYFDQILKHAYPGARLVQWYDQGREPCERIDEAERWVTAQAPHWRKAMRLTPGFEDPGHIGVCRLGIGLPYADLKGNRIFARGLRSNEDRITLTHEYLHLGFKHHPSGGDEAFIEATAQRLMKETVLSKGAFEMERVFE